MEAKEMKSYTNLEQSKKLTEILPIESVDMYYSDNEYPKPITKYHITYANVLYGSYDIHYFDIYGYVPCWSLAALLNVLPSSTLDSSNDHHYRLHCMERYTEWYDNAIDACVAMIEKLYKINLI